MTERTEYGLIVSFEDQSEAYVNGFEAGGLWAKMQGDVPSDDIEDVQITVHSANRVTIDRMAAASGWSAQWTDPGAEFDGWSHLTLTRAPKPTERPNPHGLKLVPNVPAPHPTETEGRV